MESSADTVLKYLTEQNRPYSVTDIFNNLHKAIGKTALQRDLDSLVEFGQIVEKTYGKQKIYYVSQENALAYTEEDLAAIDQEIETLEKEISNDMQRLKDIDAQLEALNSKLSSSDCHREIARYRKLNEELAAKLKHSDRKGHMTVDPAERVALTQQKDSLVKELRRRKKISMDAFNIVFENYPGKKKDLVEQMGLELE